MKTAILADIHGHVKPLAQLEAALSEADVVLLAGDITNFGGPEQARKVIEQLACLTTGRILAVAGNCDPPGVDAYLTAAGVNLHGRGVCVDGWWFVGAAGALPNLGDLPNEAGERMFTEALERGYAECGPTAAGRLVLVTHQPAWNTALDAVGPGRHTGNRAVRLFVDKARPILAVSGHIHEIVGADRLGPTTLVSPAPAKDGRCTLAELAEEGVHVRFV